MIPLHFKNSDEFEILFRAKTLKVTDSIVSGIEKAMQNNRPKADLFQITFEGYDTAYEVSLSKSEWKHALESCLDHYHKLELADQQIETWKLLEAAKVW
jgi:cystathionine beta-lyase family protein involved in aluminum resistance|tara:strand:+ start:75 stop:371 length:297 start_codon:yes stop_codon:yes gene_type:complete